MDAPPYYQCPICRLNFTEENVQQQCEAWCRTHDSCNLRIASQSLEAQKASTCKNYTKLQSQGEENR